MSNTVTPITTDISLAPSRAAKAKRRPMSAEQRAKLSAAQRAYVANDPRWAEHRRKLAAAQEAKRMTLMENEVAAILEMRRKGRTFTYIAEEIGVASTDRPHMAPAW